MWQEAGWPSAPYAVTSGTASLSLPKNTTYLQLQGTRFETRDDHDPLDGDVVDSIPATNFLEPASG